MNLELEPKRDFIIARLIDMSLTDSGLHLPETQMKNVSVFALVEQVGPDVKSCKPGDVVLPMSVGHVWLRGGLFHRCTIEDEHVIASVKGLDSSRFRFVDERNANGPSKLVATG